MKKKKRKKNGHVINKMQSNAPMLLGDASYMQKAVI